MITTIRGRDLDERDLGRGIFHALAADDTQAALAKQFDWMPEQLLHGFIQDAVPLQNAGSVDLEVFVARFAHTVRAEWNDRGTGLPEWAAPIAVFAAAPAALLYTAIGVWR